MIGLLLAALLAAAPVSLERVLVVEYGPDPPGCGMFHFGRQMRVRTATGETVDLVLSCATEGRYGGRAVPPTGTYCDITYEILDPGQIAVFAIEGGPATEGGWPRPPQNVVKTLACA